MVVWGAGGVSLGSNKLRQNPGLARDPTGYISASIQCNTKHLTIQFSTSENALKDTNDLVVTNCKYYNPRKQLTSQGGYFGLSYVLSFDFIVRTGK